MLIFLDESVAERLRRALRNLVALGGACICGPFFYRATNLAILAILKREIPYCRASSLMLIPVWYQRNCDVRGWEEGRMLKDYAS